MNTEGKHWLYMTPLLMAKALDYIKYAAAWFSLRRGREPTEDAENGPSTEIRFQDDGTMSILIHQVIAFNLVEGNARDS